MIHLLILEESDLCVQSADESPGKKNPFILMIIQVISPHTIIPALLFLFFLLNMTNETKMVMSEQTKNEFQNLSLPIEVCFPFAWSPADSWPE